MLLLKLPQLRVDVKRPSEVGLPLLVSILREVSAEEEREETDITHRTSLNTFWSTAVKLVASLGKT